MCYRIRVKINVYYARHANDNRIISCSFFSTNNYVNKSEYGCLSILAMCTVHSDWFDGRVPWDETTKSKKHDMHTHYSICMILIVRMHIHCGNGSMDPLENVRSKYILCICLDRKVALFACHFECHAKFYALAFSWP